MVVRAIRCDKCTVRIPLSHRKLVCGICRNVQHYRCSKLSKTDVESIINTPHYDWSCYECISAILPLNACVVETEQAISSRKSRAQFKTACHACNHMSYKQHNIAICPWCSNKCHKKCIMGSLGCIKCCDNLIPGYRCHAFELLDIGSRVNSKIFNPYDRNNHVNHIGDQIRNEEENNAVWNELSEQLVRCRYQLPKNIEIANDNELGILTMNIRSVHKNLQSINDRNTEFNVYDVISLNETCCNIEKLPNGLDDLTIEGFHPPVYQAPARASCRGGGLLTYVNKRVCSEDDIESINIEHEPNTDGEILFIKIKSCKNKAGTVIIGNVYRSPSARSSNNFIKIFDDALSQLRRHNKKQILIAGDFNIDLIKYNSDENSQQLINTAANHGLAQVISRPTRVTDHSASLIDHVYTNRISSVVNSSVVSFDISDHLGTYIKVSLDASFDRATVPLIRPNNNNEIHEYRIFNEANNEVFRGLIQDETWSALEGLDADTRYDKFSQIYNSHYDNAYPLNTKRIRRKYERVNPKPWITSWLEEAFHRKNELYLVFAESPTVENKTKYNKMCKFCERHKNKAKNKYYKKYFDDYSDNSRKQWQLINNFLNRHKKKTGVSKLIDTNGSIITKPDLISEKFNEYFF